MTTAVAPPVNSTAIDRLEPLRPMPVAGVKRAMVEYQQGLHALLDDTDWQTFEDRDGRPHSFVKRSGWRKVATWFGLDLLVGSVDVDRDEHDRPLRARVVGRAVAPNGRGAEDVGVCSIDERNFSKPEHDLVATATTRALNRATSNLVGMGELSAEELADDVPPTPVPALPEWAHSAAPDGVDVMLAKLVDLVGADRAQVLTSAIEQRYEGVPNVVTGLVNALHSMLKPDAPTTPTED